MDRAPIWPQPINGPLKPGSPEERELLAGAREARRAREEAARAGVVAMMETVAPIGETPGVMPPEKSREIHQIAVQMAGPQGQEPIQVRHG